jgi:predicted metal-dependent hydrolase
VSLHPVHSAGERRRLLRDGIDQLHRGDFYAAHETWEEVWRSTTPEPKTLLQGLIQVAAALHQIRDLRRREGPRRTLSKARRNLEPYAPVALGLDVDGLLRSVATWQEWLERGEGEIPEPPRVRVVDEEGLK